MGKGGGLEVTALAEPGVLLPAPTGQFQGSSSSRGLVAPAGLFRHQAHTSCTDKHVGRPFIHIKIHLSFLNVKDVKCNNVNVKM